jgi:hypothetical protein
MAEFVVEAIWHLPAMQDGLAAAAAESETIALFN